MSTPEQDGEDDEAGSAVEAALMALDDQAAFLQQSWRTLVEAFPPVDAKAETLAFEHWAQDTAAALMREDASLAQAAPKAFWAALITAAETVRLRPEVAASLWRRHALL